MENPEQAANAMTTLINQTNYLLDQQIKSVKFNYRNSGVILESHQQRAAKILTDKQKKNQEFDEYLKNITEVTKKNKSK
ncbi:MAG: hypothetical protein COT91_04200 [Candidatus Doudnabacteria bacterium CG10_big_fil_rev_8_21_14_0_10_41_10]|uniref:Uncharacterized protein n=1 Tax=Candidatus Doudnabacteria bacterium CG10_big_fil_rev_8_21_14_0_10_41_10 TaxID=1974551 RepID=A0A2H0VCU5_9BACT|nr:MAG: hypothetical protein COT91_04200 [Candidatus Doudnabacteria bacterium CG10_big_fil_rev_8_21_14_0_10_41_10]